MANWNPEEGRSEGVLISADELYKVYAALLSDPRGKEVARRRLIKRIVLGVVVAGVLGGTGIAVARLKPAAPSVDMSGLWPGTVAR